MEPEQKRLLRIAGSVVGFAWLAAPIATILFFGKPESAGTFGDLYGVVNALFSGLALLGVVAAILLQQKELSLSTQELRNSARALTKQVELSADTARMQALPLLIDLQKSRIKTYGGKFFRDFDSHEFTDEWLQQRVKEMQDVLNEAEPKLEGLKDQLKNTPSHRVFPYNEDPTRDPIVREIGDWQEKLDVARSVLPQMQELIVYMRDLKNLYAKMSETKLENI